MKIFARSIHYLMQHKKQVLLGVLALIIVDLLQLFVPKVIQFTIDGLLADALTSSMILRNAGILLALALSIAFFRIWWRYFIQGTSFKIEESLRNELYAHFLKMERNFYHNHKIGDLMAHATNDLTAVRMVYGMGFVAFFDGVCLSLASIGFMMAINPKLTLLVVIPLPILTAIVTVLGKLTHKRFGAVQETFSKLSGKAQESFAGIRVVKGFTQENADLDQFAAISKDVVNKNVALVKVWGLFHPLMMAVTGVSAFLIIYFGGSMAVLNKMSVGEFVAFSTYLGILAWPMMAIGWVMNIYQRGKASMERINTILDQEPAIHDRPDAVDYSAEKCSIEIKNLTFTYPGSSYPALENINLKITAGQRIAIVGRTGSGKSTLINLLLRNYDVTAGEILFNDQPHTAIRLNNLRSLISVVPQETFLFSESIAENIAFSDVNSAEEKIHSAAKNAIVYDNIVEFPAGFQTELGEKGVNLSGGQKQRISIARALLKNAPVIILDDSLSAVDTETEEKILHNLSDCFEGKTSILISHRISSIRNSDHIFVLDNGKIIEDGTHEQLLAVNGLYADMYSKQQLEEKLDGRVETPPVEKISEEADFDTIESEIELERV